MQKILDVLSNLFSLFETGIKTHAHRLSSHIGTRVKCRHVGVEVIVGRIGSVRDFGSNA
jgi:hypothetical protein